MPNEGDNIASIAEARRKAVPAPDLRPAPKSSGGGQDGKPGILHDAPITPLGVQGGKLWLLDSLNQLCCVATDCRKGDMMLWFGGDEYLTEAFPQYGKAKGDAPAPVVGFNQTHAQTALIRDCWSRGVFNPQGRVFGRGAHAVGHDRTLMLHMGDTVMVVGRPDKMGQPSRLVEEPAGRIRIGEGRRGLVFFPAYDDLPPPAVTASGADEGNELLTLLGDWQWVEPDASPLLVLGFIAQSFICGALPWRSHAWLAGPTAAGKSALQALIRAILDGWAVFTSDASEAAVRQVLNDDTLAVLIDEAEKDDNPEKQRAMLNLAKKASTGDKILRGSADHNAKQFTAQSCFLFSSVLHSLSKGEERNRVAILNMRAIPETPRDANGELVDLWKAPDPTYWRDVGRKMHRRMIEQWPRLEQTLADYKREIASHGLEGRWQDTYGTLLACADCLLFETAPSRESMLNAEYGREKRFVLRILPLMRVARSEARTDVERCIAYLMSRLIPGEHGKAPETVGQWIIKGMALGKTDDETGGINHAARERLKSHGLRLITVRDPTPDEIKKGRKGKVLGPDPLPGDAAWDSAYLSVAYGTNAGLSELFRTANEWAGGGWIQSLGKIEGVVTGLKVRTGGPYPDNVIAVPLKALRGEEG